METFHSGHPLSAFLPSLTNFPMLRCSRRFCFTASVHFDDGDGEADHHNGRRRPAVVSRGWVKASAGCFQVCRSCVTLCQMMSFQKVSISPLTFLAGLPGDLPSRTVSNYWHALSIGRLGRRRHVLPRTIFVILCCE